MDYEANRAHYDAPTTPVHYPQPKHGAYGSSGRAAITRAARNQLVMSGSLCPLIKDLKTAEKQYRRERKGGSRESVVQEAKFKIVDFHYRVAHWQWQRSHTPGDEMCKEVEARFALDAQAWADNIERVAQNLGSHPEN